MAGFSPHPENFIQMSPWEGDSGDHRLEDAIDFLEMLAFSRLSDVRQAITQFAGKAFPQYFDELQEAQLAVNQKSKEKSLQGRLSGLFSISKPSLNGAISSATSYWTRKEDRKQARHMEFDRIKSLMQKQLEAEVQREKEYYAQHKMSLLDLFSKGPPPPPPSPSTTISTEK